MICEHIKEDFGWFIVSTPEEAITIPALPTNKGLIIKNGEKATVFSWQDSKWIPIIEL